MSSDSPFSLHGKTDMKTGMSVVSGSKELTAKLPIPLPVREEMEQLKERVEILEGIIQHNFPVPFKTAHERMRRVREKQVQK